VLLLALSDCLLITIKCSFLLLVLSSGMYLACNAMWWASISFQSEILPQDYVYRYFERAGLPSAINPNRHPTCSISVSCRAGFRSFAKDQCRENSKHEQRITLPIQTRSNLFGVHLEELMGYDGEKGGAPRVVKDCVQYLRQTGTSVVLSPNPSSHYVSQASPMRVYFDVPRVPPLCGK
jgi:hypothetical protein